jgi:hypothetical protein
MLVVGLRDGTGITTFPSLYPNQPNTIELFDSCLRPDVLHFPIQLSYTYRASTPMRPTTPARPPATIWVGRAARPEEEDDEAPAVTSDSLVVDAFLVEVEVDTLAVLVMSAVELEKEPPVMVPLEDGAEVDTAGTEVGTALPAPPTEMK